MDSFSNEPTPRPSKHHPLLSEPSLFIIDLPDYVTGGSVDELFKGYEIIHPTNKKPGIRPGQGGPGDALFTRIEFANLAQAERALATLQRCPIPNTNPPVLLVLSTIPDPDIPSPAPHIHPRWVKYLPAEYTDSQLYDLLRPFGPIASAQAEGELGGVVQFWNEQDACDAELSPILVDGRKISIQAYNPRNLYCTNLDVDNNILRATFSKFGYVLSARVMVTPNGLSRGFGFVLYRTPEEASTAKKALNRTILGTTSINIRFHEPKPSPKPVVPSRVPQDDPSGSNLTPITENRPATSSPTVDNEEMTHAYRGGNPHARTNRRTWSEPMTLRQPTCKGVDLTGEHDLLGREVRTTPIADSTKNWQAESIRLLAEVAKLRVDMTEREKSLAKIEGEKKLLLMRLRTEERAREEAVESLMAEKEAIRAESERARQLLMTQLQVEKREKEDAVKALRVEQDALNTKSEEVDRNLAISESRQKMMELEADKSSWEVVRMQREIQEMEEAAKAEEQRMRREREEVVASLKTEQQALRAESEAEKQVLMEQLRAEKQEKEEVVTSLMVEQEATLTEVGDLKQMLAKSELRWKIVKLEADRSLWEVAKKQREMQEKENAAKAEEQQKQREREVVVETLKAEHQAMHSEIGELKQKLAMSESRRKILELEADRPIWEAAQKQRNVKEAAKAEEQRKKAELAESQRKMRELKAQEDARKREEKEEARRRAMEEEEARKEREAAEKKAREEEERERQERERVAELRRMEQWRLAVKSEQARCVQRDKRLWGHVTWTNEIALARYKALSEEFEKLKFSETQPLTFEVIPWPVLEKPFGLEVGLLGWSMVEAFFTFVRVRMGWESVEYKSIVEKAHRMFHPDKWRSRGLLNTVPDEELKNSLETAGNIVVQALTPLWRRSKGYD